MLSQGQLSVIGSWLPHGDMLSGTSWATVLGTPVPGFILCSCDSELLSGRREGSEECRVLEEGTGK